MNDERPAYMCSGERAAQGHVAFWRAKTGQQLSVFEREDGTAWAIWEDDRRDFPNAAEAVEFAAELAPKLGLPNGDLFEMPTDEEVAAVRRARAQMALRLTRTSAEPMAGVYNPEPSKAVQVPDEALGPWYLTYNRPRVDRPCKMCGDRIHYHRNYFELLGGVGEWENAVIHTQCGYNAEKHSSPGIDLIWDAGT